MNLSIYYLQERIYILRWSKWLISINDDDDDDIKYDDDKGAVECRWLL